MKSNIVEWELHYREVLNKYFTSLKTLLENYNEEELTYNEFVNFCYRNTKKTLISQPGLFAKQFYATIGNNV